MMVQFVVNARKDDKSGHPTESRQVKLTTKTSFGREEKKKTDRDRVFYILPIIINIKIPGRAS